MAHPFAPTTNEISPVLRLFGPLAGHVGALLRFEPTLGYRLALSSPRVIHAVAIYGHHEAEHDTPARVIASTLLVENPRDLLRRIIPDQDPRLYRVLDRATLPAWSQADYAALDAVLRSEVADLLLNRGEITPAMVRHAQAILKSDPIVRRARHAIGNEHERRNLETVITVLSRIGLLCDLAAVPEGAGAQAVARRAAADLGRVTPIDIEFPPPPGWTRVRRLGDLWEHGTRMRLCLRPGYCGAGDYALSMMMNRSVFLHHQEPNLLAQFRQMPANA